MSVRTVFKRIFGFFFPNVCISCGNIIGNEDRICKTCKDNISKIRSEKACLFCGLEKPDCDYRYSVYYFYGIASCYHNDGTAKNIVYNYKLKHRDYYAKLLAKDMSADLKEKFGDVHFDYVTSVPPSLISRFKNGFDQTHLLAKYIGRDIKTPVRKDIIGCKPLATPQHINGYKKRFDSVRGKYFIKKHIEAENVLLVDDIKTTGATLDACARELLFSGARRVYCVTVSASQKPSGFTPKIKN